MTRVVRFGADESQPDDLADIEERMGGPTDVALVDGMSSDKIRSALALWLAGATLGDIASQLGMRSPATVRVALERALADTVDDTEDRSKLRQKMSLTLDRLLRATMPKAVDGQNPEQLAAVRTVMTIVDRKIRLHGLDAPQEHVVHMPGQDEFARVIELAARGRGLSLPEEGDPFADDIEDAEVVDDEDD